MATKRRFVDVVSTNLTFVEENESNPKFKDILLFLNSKKHRYQEKILELSLLDTQIPNCIVGIIVTTQDKDIPPIRDKQTGQYSPVIINPVNQGLAFANIFLYDFQRNILLYEINRNGCFLSQFSDFIYSRWNEMYEDIRFAVTYPVVARKNEYNRMLQMDYYKKITVELFNPSVLVDCFEDESDSIQNNILKQNIRTAQQSNANFIKLEQVTLNKRFNPMGLSRSMVQGFVDAVKLNIADKGYRGNIKTLKVEGYTSDVEDSRRSKPIDLLLDAFNEFFKITDIQIHIDVQQTERKEGIEALYNKILPELRQLVG
jgi:hypothetical protein